MCISTVSRWMEELMWCNVVVVELWTRTFLFCLCQVVLCKLLSFRLGCNMEMTTFTLQGCYKDWDKIYKVFCTFRKHYTNTMIDFWWSSWSAALCTAQKKNSYIVLTLWIIQTAVSYICRVRAQMVASVEGEMFCKAPCCVNRLSTHRRNQSSQWKQSLCMAYWLWSWGRGAIYIKVRRLAKLSALPTSRDATGHRELLRKGTDNCLLPGFFFCWAIIELVTYRFLLFDSGEMNSDRHVHIRTH